MKNSNERICKMCSWKVPYMKYAPNMEYHCSRVTECDNTVMNHQVDA
jgi:hypothetical protein